MQNDLLYGNDSGNVTRITESGTGGTEDRIIKFTWQEYGDLIWRKTSQKVLGPVSVVHRKKPLTMIITPGI